MPPYLVKVIATLGPASEDPSTVEGMLREGAWGFRINTSHGDEDQWDRLLEAILYAEGRVGVRPAIIVDLQGPRVRVSRDQEPLRVPRGGEVIFCDEPRSGCVALDSRAFFEIVREGDTILVGDGDAELRVIEAGAGRAKAVAVVDSLIEPGKGVVVRGKDYPLPPLTERDKRALKWASGKPVSHIMVSYTRSREHVEAARTAAREAGLDVAVLAKIETPGAVARVDEIAEASDGIVVARGDLGLHFPLEEMPVVQASIAMEAVLSKKPLVIATEILASMVERPQPTRSEVTDIFEAVRLGCDSLLLTSETAIGRYPVEAVKWARRASAKAASYVTTFRPEPTSPAERLANGLVELAESLEAPLLVYSREGRLPRRISAFKPRVPVYVGAGKVDVERRLRILWGLNPVTVGEYPYDEGLEETRKRLESLLEGSLVEASWSREEGVYNIRVRNLRY